MQIYLGNSTYILILDPFKTNITPKQIYYGDYKFELITIFSDI